MSRTDDFNQRWPRAGTNATIYDILALLYKLRLKQASEINIKVWLDNMNAKRIGKSNSQGGWNDE